MNKTVNINLAGMAFVIDENAYEVLQKYLEALRHKFSNETERTEIMNDIEARIAEMLNAKNKEGKQVIGIADINEITATMGRPEDIAGEDTSSAASGEKSSNTGGSVKKRLFRDPDDKKVSGVISGACHYFGIADPVWVRLAVVALCFLSFGTVLLVYIILAIVIPEADTAAEKLQMKGEPVTISTIEKEVKDSAQRAGESLRDFGNNSTPFEKIGHVLLTVMVGAAKIVAGIVALFGLLILGILLASLFGVSVAGSALLNQAPDLLVDGSSTITLFKAGLILFVGAMVCAVVYAVIRLFFGKRTQVRPLKWVLLGAWWLGIILMGVAGYKGAISYKSSATTVNQVALMQPQNNHLLVQLTDTAGNKYQSNDEDESEDKNFNFSLFGFEMNGVDIDGIEKLTIGEPSLQLMPSVNDSFYLYTYITARGRNKADAEKNSEWVVYKIMQTDTLISLPAEVLLNAKGKWRAQGMKIRIAIPEGKSLSFADNIDNWAATVKGNGKYDDTYFNNTTWTTQNGTIKCIRGENHFSSDDKSHEEEDIMIEKMNKKDADKDDFYKGNIKVEKNGNDVKIEIVEDKDKKVTTTTTIKDGKEEKKVIIEKK